MKEILHLANTLAFSALLHCCQSELDPLAGFEYGHAKPEPAVELALQLRSLCWPGLRAFCTALTTSVSAPRR